jgi:sugar O-acyltransferase (sialic acid O-acetyltransferase NeuD family)
MKIYLLGASNPETIRMIRAVRCSTPNIEIGGFLDNDPNKKNTNFYGFEVLGGLELVHNLAGMDVGFVNLITGNTRTRYETSREIVAAGGRLANFIHPSIDLTMCRLGVGIYLQESVIMQAGVEIGDNSSIHMGTLIGHETIVGRSVFIAHAVSISGCCSINDGTFIGTNATVLPRIKIGRWVTIGAGAVITKDVPDYAVVVGNPGKIIKFTETTSITANLKTNEQERIL